MAVKLYPCGHRGCAGRTKRRGAERYCAQKAVVWDSKGRGWCYYHHPWDPKKFGEGYVTHRWS